jgi:NAD-dependent dihydropyrimidine dehydrogenase PreA subunit
MAYVITEPCVDVKDGSCTEVCPVDCIYEGGRMYYIQPDECINCGLCLSICPVDAIRDDENVAAEQQDFIGINREFFDAAVSGLGSPGGWNKGMSVAVDHPEVARRAPGK